MAASWLEDPGKELQRGRFPGAIRSDDSDSLSSFHLERNVIDCPELFRINVICTPCTASDETFDRCRDEIAKRIMTFAASELLPDAVEDNRGVTHQMFSANPNSARWNANHANA